MRNSKIKPHTVYIIFVVLFILIILYRYLRFKSIIETMSDDMNPTKTDYTNQIKSVQSMGISSKGTWKSLDNNVRGLANIVKGLSTDQRKVVTGGNRLGVKLAVDTGYTCNDPDGAEQTLYTYLDNYGGNNGLLMEVGNSIERYMERVSEYASAMAGAGSTTCREVTLQIITNSGRHKREKYHIQESELDKIDSKNIISRKAYDADTANKTETFRGVRDYDKDNIIHIMDNYILYDPIVVMYFAYLSLVVGYVLYKGVNKLPMKIPKFMKSISKMRMSKSSKVFKLSNLKKYFNI